jgi:hypothetical protein
MVFIREIPTKKRVGEPTLRISSSAICVGWNPTIYSRLFRGPSIVARAADAQGILHIFAIFI